MGDVFANPDGSCVLVTAEDTAFVWASHEELAADWLAEQHEPDPGAGPAYEFLDEACSAATPGIVDILVTIAEAAADDGDMLGALGAGHLEDLVSHSGNGAVVLEEVDRAARRSPAFRTALRGVWLGWDVPPHVKARLVGLGGIDIGDGEGKGAQQV